MKKILILLLTIISLISYSQDKNIKFYYDIGVQSNYFSIPDRGTAFSKGFQSNIGLSFDKSFSLFIGYNFHNFNQHKNEIELNYSAFNLGLKTHIRENGFISFKYLNYYNKFFLVDVNEFEYKFNLSFGYGFIFDIKKADLNLEFNFGMEEIEVLKKITNRLESQIKPTFGINLSLSNF